MKNLKNLKFFNLQRLNQNQLNSNSGPGIMLSIDVDTVARTSTVSAFMELVS